MLSLSSPSLAAVYRGVGIGPDLVHIVLPRRLAALDRDGIQHMTGVGPHCKLPTHSLAYMNQFINH